MALIKFMNYSSYFLFEFNKYLYSIDMIRINFELNESIIDINDKFYELLNKFGNTQFCDLNTFFSKSWGYRYLYQLKIDDSVNKCSFSIGIQLGSKSENKYKGFIEYNPNKCDKVKIFNDFLSDFKNLCFCFKVVRYDLAVDIPVNRKYVKMVRYKNCNYSIEYYNNTGVTLNSSVTEYLGRRNHNKFVKVYDKTAESNLNYDLTRIEFTFERDYCNFDDLPKFLYFYNRSNDLSSNNLVLLNLLVTSEDFNYYFKMLSYRKRKALEPFLSDYYINLETFVFSNLRKLVLSLEF